MRCLINFIGEILFSPTLFFLCERVPTEEHDLVASLLNVPVQGGWVNFVLVNLAKYWMRHMWLRPSFLYWTVGRWWFRYFQWSSKTICIYAFLSVLSHWVSQQTCSSELVGNSNSRAIWQPLKPALYHALQYHPFSNNHLFSSLSA